MLLPITVFIADDDTDDQFFFEQALKELCAECTLNMSFDGEELINKIQKLLPVLPDLIILDINMPKVNGLQALSLIRANPAFSRVPVIIYSTTGNPATIKQAYESGANFYLRKPRSFIGLKEEIQHIFEDHLLHKGNTSLSEE